MLKPNKIRQLLALAIIVAGGGLAATIAVKVYWEKRPGLKSGALSPTADVSLKKIRFTETKKGKKLWDLTADKAEYDREKEIARLTGVRLVVAGDGTMGDITLIADRAEYQYKSGDVQLAGHVDARSGSGMEFASDSAGYLAARSMIKAPGHVRFSDGMLTVEGVGMELATDSRRVRITHGVTARMVPRNRNE
jgi:LPS export ABC transporter protein LptC